MTENNCVRCGQSLFKRSEFSYRNKGQLSGPAYVWLRDALREQGFDVSEESIICNKCRCKINQERVAQPLQDATQTLNVTVLLPNVSQAGKSKGSCVICRSPYKSGRTVTIPFNVRLDLLIMFNMNVAEGCVICLSHLDKKTIKPDTPLENSPRKNFSRANTKRCFDASNLIQKL